MARGEEGQSHMRRMPRILALLTILTTLAWPVAAQDTSARKTDKKPAAATTTPVPTTKSATDDPDYVIGPEDALAINVWKEAELTHAVQVRPDGKISLPLLNDVQAAGLTPLQLAASLTEKLKKFVSEPQVTVIVTAINSRKFYVMGEVSRSGAYPLLHGMTVLQALSGAGSFTQFANVKKIYLLRTEDGKQVKHAFNYKDVIKGLHPEQNIELKPGDTIVVP